MFEDLSQKQIEILLFIKSEIQRQGYPPSVREIGKGVDLKSTSTVHGHLEKLEEKEYIRKDATKPRAIEIIDRSSDHMLNTKKTVDIPVIGKVTAGTPILAVENIEDSFPVPYDMVKDYDAFMLQVEGDSMIDAGILDGDFVVVKKQDIANDGDIVIALIDDEATIKRFFKEKDRVRLQPENDLMEPIYTRNLLIAGVVTGVYRKF